MHDVICGSVSLFFFLMPFLAISHRKLWHNSRRWTAWRRRGRQWTIRALWWRSWRRSVSKWSTTVKNLRLVEQRLCGGVGSRRWVWASEVGSLFFCVTLNTTSPPCSKPLALESLTIDRVSPWEHGVSWSWIRFFSYVFLTVLSHPVLPLALILFTSNREFWAAGKSPCMCERGEDRGERKLIVNLQINT